MATTVTMRISLDRRQSGSDSSSNSGEEEEEQEHTTVAISSPPPPINKTSDWPCPAFEACTFHRRPSWQVDGSLASSFNSSSSGSNGPGSTSNTTLVTPVIKQTSQWTASSSVSLPSSPNLSHHQQHQQHQCCSEFDGSIDNRLTAGGSRVHNPFALSLYGLPARSSSSSPPKQLAAVPAPAASYWHPSRDSSHAPPPTFVSPFEATHSSSTHPQQPQQHQYHSITSPVEEPLSPYCLPGSPFSPTDSLVSSFCSPSYLSTTSSSSHLNDYYYMGGGTSPLGLHNNSSSRMYPPIQSSIGGGSSEDVGTPASSVRSSLSSCAGETANTNSCGNGPLLNTNANACSPARQLQCQQQQQQQQQQTFTPFEMPRQATMLQQQQQQQHHLQRPTMRNRAANYSGSSCASVDRTGTSFYQPLTLGDNTAPAAGPSNTSTAITTTTTTMTSSEGSSSTAPSMYLLRPPTGPEQKPQSSLTINVPQSQTQAQAQQQQQQHNDNTHYRRRSVDVGTLTNMRGHQRHGRTLREDAPAAAFVPPDQLKAHRAKKISTQRSRDSLFSQHLTSILSHSLSLCSVVADSEVESCSTSASPRSSISSVISNGSFISERERTSFAAEGSSTSSSNVNTASTGGKPISQRSSSFAPRVRLPSSWLTAPTRRKELIGIVAGWSFDANTLDLDELCECACIIFESVLEMEGLAEAVGGGSPLMRMRTFLASLRAAYHPRNAYHNFAHAVDVLQACYSFVTKLGLAPPVERLAQDERNKIWSRDPKLVESGAIGDILRPMDVFALLIAAIGHDVGHPGLTNAYMINARTPAAQVYNDKSVLENFHSVTLIRMLKLHGFGHLLEFDGGAGTDFRQVLLTSILVTDMSRHFPFVGQLTELGTSLAKDGFQSKNIAEDRLLICAGLMKCADISNPTRPHDVAACWSSALLEEWQVQAEIETRYDLPVSVVVLPNGERTGQAKSQVGFIKLFCQPLFDAMAAALPTFKTFADHCRRGREVWELTLQHLEQAESTDQTVILSPNDHGDATMNRATPAADSIPIASVSSSPGSDWNTTLSHRARSDAYDRKHMLPPHRVLRTVRSRDSNLTSISTQSDIGTSPSAASTFATSPATSSFYSHMAQSPSAITGSPTTGSLSTWIPSATMEGNSSLAEEACTDNCTEVTALCSTCARRQRAEDTYIPAEYNSYHLSVPQYPGQWPPDPFRPALSAKA